MNSNWNYDIFDNLFLWKEKSHIKSGDGKATGKYKMFVCSDTEIKYFDEYLEQGESLIFGTGGKASCHFTDEKFAYSTDCVVAQKLNDFLHTKFYYYYFRRNNIGELQNTFTGSGLQHTSKKKIGVISVPVPPVDEQQRIVDKIDELFSKLDKGVEELNKVKDQLKIYRQAVLKEAFEGIETYDYISSAFDVSGGLTKSSKRNSYPLKYNYIRVANVLYNAINTAEIKNIGVTTDEVEKTLLKENDLLFVEGNGSKEQIGRVAIWNGEIENFLHQNHIIKARPLGNILSKFALYFLMSSFGRNQIIKIASSTSGLYTLSTNKIKNLFIPFADKLQQEETICYIEYRISLCDKLEQTVNESLQKAESLRQSILKQAFERKLV